jgi:hypothetical protein
MIGTILRSPDTNDYTTDKGRLSDACPKKIIFVISCVSAILVALSM